MPRPRNRGHSAVALLLIDSRCLPSHALAPIRQETARGLSISPDGRFAAASHIPFEGDERRLGAPGYVFVHNLVRVWKVSTGEQYHVYPTSEIKEGSRQVIPITSSDLLSEERMTLSYDERYAVIANVFSYHQCKKRKPVLTVFNLETRKRMADLR